MTYNWVKDIADMHDFYNFRDVYQNFTDEQKIQFLKFRFDFLQEETDEGKAAIELYNPEEIVDSLIDICVVAIGTLDAFGVDSQKAWNEVLKANMSKQPGIKEGRPNPLNLPDLMKPEGWKPPSHFGNHGNI